MGLQLQTEISAHDWRVLKCGCGGSAEHLPADLTALASIENDDDVGRTLLDGHVYGATVVYEPGPAVISVVLAALTEDMSEPARRRLLEVLLTIVAGEAHPLEGPDDILNQCVTAAREGIWLLYREIRTGPSKGATSYAFEILTLIDPDRDRLLKVRDSFADRLSFDLLLDDF